MGIIIYQYKDPDSTNQDSMESKRVFSWLTWNSMKIGLHDRLMIKLYNLDPMGLMGPLFKLRGPGERPLGLLKLNPEVLPSYSGL